MDVSQSVLSKKVRGKVGWSVSDLRAAAYELGTTVSYLVGEIEDPSPLPEDMSPLSDLNRRPSLYIVGGSDWEGMTWPDEAAKHKQAA